MRRKSKYLLACLLLLLGVSLFLAQGRSTATVVKAGPTDRAIAPNILWIVAEDLSPDLGCYGNRLVRTPNIDALAAEGVRFTRAFSTAQVCSPSLRDPAAHSRWSVPRGTVNSSSAAPT